VDSSLPGHTMSNAPRLQTDLVAAFHIASIVGRTATIVQIQSLGSYLRQFEKGFEGM
jgi:hypothetical protein